MKKMKMALLAMLTGMSLVACASPTAPVISLRPQVTPDTINVGKGKAVALQVVDARAQGNFGAAKIDSAQNVTQIFTNEVSKGLKNHGFQLNVAADTQVTVKLLAIDYRVLTGLTSENTETFVSAEVNAKTAKGGTYRKTYNASAYNDNYLSMTKEDASTEVNTAVNKLLNNMVNDPVLMQFLAG
jgi:uncharacterized lipoprotein YajG